MENKEQIASEQTERNTEKQWQEKIKEEDSVNEIELLKKRLAELEKKEQKRSENVSVVERLKNYYNSHQKMFLIMVFLLPMIVLIAVLSVTLIGIRGVYVSEEDPYQFFSFGPSKMEEHVVAKSKDDEDFIVEGKWKKKGDTLSLIYEDELFGELTLEYKVRLKDSDNKLILIDTDTKEESVYNRVEVFGYNAVKNKKIRITFNLNGGKSDEEVKNLEIKFGETFNYNPPTPTLEDSVFKGWYLSKDGYANDEKPYKLGVPVYENTIIYANWKEHKQHEYNEFCTCIECGKINHDCGTEGICIVCGLQVHENLESCYCDSCSKYYHSFDEESICTLCGSDGIVYSGNELHKYYGVASTLVIPDSVTSIGDYAFSNCSSLESVVIPDSVTSIGWDAFRDCSSLTSIVIPDSVTSIAGDAFEGCSSLESVVIPDSVTSIGGSAFRDCSSLTSVVIGDSVTSIGDWAFRDCSSLTSVVIGDSVTRIGSSAFYNCSSLTSVVIPDSVTSIGSYAFYACSSLTIYCEAENKPSGWDSRWIFDDRPVEWGYEG